MSTKNLQLNMLNNTRDLSRIFFDYQSTTPMDERVVAAMSPYFATKFGNEHSNEHAYGWEANQAVNKAKHQIAGFIDCLEDELVFTSGATESNNLAIVGTAYAAKLKSKKRTILISSIEHKCVLGAARFTEQLGFTILKIPVTSSGLVCVEALEELLSNNDVLLTSVMACNNEIGVCQDLEAIGNLCRRYGSLFHVDAAQAAYMKLNVSDINVDLLSLSAHKAYGPKGIGAIYINQFSQLKPQPIIWGGGQQDGYRSGTVPVPLVVGMGEAISILNDCCDDEKLKICKLRETLIDGLYSIIPNLKINGTLKYRHPGNLNLLLPNTDARSFILSLQPSLAISTGAACSSGIIEPSHVLRAIGLTKEECDCSFRLSLGRFSTINEVNRALEIIKAVFQNSPD